MTTASNQPASEELASSLESLVDEYLRWLRAQATAGGASNSRLRLLFSLHCEGPQRMTDLASALGVTPRNITALVDGLETDGIVRRTAHPTDRRATIIELTDAAPDPAQLMGQRRDAIAQLFTCMSPAEQADYLAMTRRLEARFKAARVIEGATA